MTSPANAISSVENKINTSFVKTNEPKIKGIEIVKKTLEIIETDVPAPN